VASALRVEHVSYDFFDRSLRLRSRSMSLVKMIRDLSQASVHALPAIREMPGRTVSAAGPRGKATDLVARGFAEFARVPYQNPLSRQQWEELWEAEPKKRRPLLDVQCPLAGVDGDGAS
jgi:hypothetical protein